MTAVCFTIPLLIALWQTITCSQLIYKIMVRITKAMVCNYGHFLHSFYTTDIRTCKCTMITITCTRNAAMHTHLRLAFTYIRMHALLSTVCILFTLQVTPQK